MERDLFIGRRAVALGFASAKEILECLKMQVAAEALLGKHLFLGELLFVRGLVDEQQYRELVAGASFAGAPTEAIAPGDLKAPKPAPAPAPRVPLLGEALIEKGLATPAEVLQALDRQREEDLKGAPHRLLGEILVAQNVVSEQDLNSTLKLVLKPPQDAPGKPARPSQKG